MQTNNSTKKNGLVIWLLGLSGAGKSTLSELLHEKLAQKGIYSLRLDGDDLRQGLNSDLGFSVTDRSENIRRAAEVSKILSSKNIVTICSFITPLALHRNISKKILKENYFEVFIDCSIETCAKRDVKGLYEQAQKNDIKDFTGVGSDFERPQKPDLTIFTENQSITESSDILFEKVYKLLRD